MTQNYLSSLTVCKDGDDALMRTGREGAREASGSMISGRNNEVTRQQKVAIGSKTEMEHCYWLTD